MVKRILIFSTAYFPLVGGAEVAVKEITDRLSFEFVMITARIKPELPEHEKIGNIDVYRVGVGNNWDKFRLIWSGWKKAKELVPPAGGFDAVWSIMASYAGFAALRFKKRNPSVPFLLTLQEGDSKRHIYKHVWWCWPYFKQIFKRADKIQAISNYLAQWAKDLGAACPVVVVPNGVDTKNFQFSIFNFQSNLNDQISNVKTSLGLGSTNKVVITASRLVKKNGVEDLIKAMCYLPENVNLLVAGSGEMENELRNVVKSKKLDGRVHFLGNISHVELPKYFWASDVFCRPSLSEGLGNAFLEAMSAGLPIVGTNVGGIPDFLKDGETGLFCRVGDPADIAKQIKRIFNDPLLSEKLRVNGRKLVEDKYSWDIVANEMLNIFQSV